MKKVINLCWALFALLIAYTMAQPLLAALVKPAALIILVVILYVVAKRVFDYKTDRGA